MSLLDASSMPFGKYKGQPMGSIPADYFFYLWTKLDFEHKSTDVANYIRENLKTLEIEYPDGIWRGK
jgi:uncharacterized protein (DUF3820 family)